MVIISSSTWTLSVKALLLSAAAILASLSLKISLPYLRVFFYSAVPQIWSSLLSWLTPPYLYLVINGIIISIAASSKFYQHTVEEPSEKSGTAVVRTDFEVPDDHYEAKALKSPVKNWTDVHCTSDQASDAGSPVYQKAEEGREQEEEVEYVISRSNWEPKLRVDRAEYSIPMEKPLVSARVGHRKSVKASPEGKRPLGVARPKRQETLESTWRTITDGRAMPLTRHLKKSDTWDVAHGRMRTSEGQQQQPRMKNCETVKEHRQSQQSPPASPSPSPRWGRLPSLSQDELNRRVEAFIKKFNEEMRQQRNDSLKHYSAMINR